MASNVLHISLDLDSKQFNVGMRNAIGTFTRFNGAVVSSNTAVKAHHGAMRQYTKSFRDFSIGAFALSSTMNILWGATGRWMLALQNTAGELERMELLLRGMSNASTAEGRIREAAEDMNFLLDMARNAPFSIGELSNSFVKMKTVGLDPAAGSLLALTDAVAAFGGNGQSLQRASVAIQQMMGKTVISMEELRQQLGEAIPTAIKDMARGLGVTVQDLTDAISLGKVEAEAALAAMTSEWSRIFDGAGQNIMNSWTGVTQRLATEWALLQKEVGDAGFSDALKGAVTDLIGTLRSESVQNFAKSLGQNLASAVRAASAAFNLLLQNIDKIVSAIKIASVIILARFVKSILASNVAISAGSGFMKAYAAASLLLARNQAAATARSVAFNQSMFVLGSALSNPLRSLRGLGAAIFALASPMNWLIGIIGGAIFAWNQFAQSGQRALQKLQDGFQLNPQELEEASQQMQKLRGHYVDTAREFVKFRDLLANDPENENLASRVAVLSSQLDAQSEHLRRMMSLQSTESTRLAEQTTQEILRVTHDGFLEQQQQNAADYRQLTQQLHDEYTQYQNAGINRQKEFNEAMAKAREDALESSVGLIEKRIAAIGGQDLTGDQTEDNRAAAIAKLRGEVDKLVQSYEAEIEADGKRLELQKLITGEAAQKKAEKAGKRIENYITSLSNRLVGMQSGQQGVNAEYEKFVALLNDGRFKDAAAAIGDPAKIEEYKNEVKRLGQQMVDIKAKQEADRVAKNQLGEATKSLADAQKELNLAILKSSPNFTDLDGQLLDVKSKYDEMRSEVKGNSEALKELNALEQREIQTLKELSSVEGFTKLKETLRDLNNDVKSSSSENAAAVLQFNETVKDAVRDANLNAALSPEAYQQRMQTLTQIYGAAYKKLQQDTSNGLTDLLNNSVSFSQQIEENMTGWVDQFANKLSDALIDGSANFEDFARGILKEITAIIIKTQVLAPLLRNFGFGGQQQVNPLEQFIGGAIGAAAGVDLAGAPLQPAAIGGAPILNVQNNTPVDIGGDGTGIDFDPQTGVTSIVLNEVTRPGPLRDTLRGAQ